MRRRASTGKKRDFTQIAKAVIDEATADETAAIEEITDTRNPHAVELSKLGASKGGKARAKKLSAKKRKEIAKKAALVRWQNR